MTNEGYAMVNGFKEEESMIYEAWRFSVATETKYTYYHRRWW